MATHDDGFIFRAAMKSRATDVITKLDELVKDGYVKKGNLGGKALDIGVGYGGSYLALSQYSNDVRGIELNKVLANMLIENKIISTDKLFFGEPSAFFRGTRDSFNFIACFHLFSGDYGLPIEQFHLDAVKSLKNGGQLVYSSQRDTSLLSQAPFYDRFKELPEVSHTTKKIISKYTIGPDDILFILTKH